jgi:tagatose 6-phosphate kinase
MRVLCVTLNASVDTTFIVDRLHRGGLARGATHVSVPGGKGNNVARVLAVLGHEVIVTGFVGGASGRFIEEGLRRLGIRTEFVRVAAESRTSLAILERGHGTVSELLETGADIDAVATSRLRDAVVRMADGVDAVVLSGSLPPGLPDGFYQELVELLRGEGPFVVLDSSGVPLELGLAAGPHLAKPNRAELRALGGDDGDAASAVRYFQEHFASELHGGMRVLLSLGAEGAVLIGRDGALGIGGIAVRPVNTVGAGDAMVAGFLHARSRGEPAATALATATAVAAASTLQPIAGVVDGRDVARLLDQTPESRTIDMKTNGKRSA